MQHDAASEGAEPRLARVVQRAGQLIEHSVTNFFRDGCTQRAAAISFYALFSIFPLAILSVAALGLVANDATVRRQVVGFLLDNLPLTIAQGRDLERVLLKVTSQGAGLGILGLVTLFFAASNVMGSIRQALNAAFRVRDERPPAQAKLWDLVMVFLFGLLVTASFGLTLFDEIQSSLRQSADDVVQGAGGVIADVLVSLGHVVPLLLAVLLFTALFRFVPAKRPRVRDIWPGVLVASIGYELAKTGFTIYLANFADYGAVYASLGSVVAFLVFVYVAAFVALLGAEFAAEWPCVRRGEYDGGPSRPFLAEVRGFVKGLFVRRG